MADEVVHYLVRTSNRVVVDCTIGGGGHAERILEASSRECILIGLDLDQDALGTAKERLSGFMDRVILRKMNFRDLARAVPERLRGMVDAVLIDCGISMLQLVKPDRGFSFERDAALDMRYGRENAPTAASVLGGITAAELRDLIWRFGEKARARRIADAIIELRNAGELKSTGDLARAVKSVIKGRAVKSLARVFLAVRCRVNEELENLAGALEALPGVLAPGGRACVITYHSEEDRIAKTGFRKYSGKCVCPPGSLVCSCGKAPLFRILTPKPVVPSAEEIRHNPSARSAKIRVVEKM
jgi:16S rRNA (cytosine1402-N4)-methyltransferase